MSNFLPRRTATFIVRIWAEYLEQTPPAWRGEIEHVERDEKTYLREISDIVRFIAHATGADTDAEATAASECQAKVSSEEEKP